MKAKLAKVKSKDEFDALVKAEGLTEEQMKELAGGDGYSFCYTEGACFGESCKALPL